MTALDVFYGDDDDTTGRLLSDGERPSFRYDSWANRRRPLSASLPVDDKAHAITFFENLLPDGVQRERLAKRLGISDTSTLAMLAAVGGDCAGALTISPEGEPRRASKPRRLVDDALFRELRESGVMPTLINQGVRLSLAGAQDKIAVVLEDDSMFLPGDDAPSTHIVKLDSATYRGIVSNEHLSLSLAREIGLMTAPARIQRLHGERVLVVERFDRAGTSRLHQEDFCQATSHPPSKKYESDGGPTLGTVASLLGRETTEPRDLFALVEWQAFNVAIGNCDGHAKNLALLRDPRVRLAPFYDLVCKRAWSSLSPSLAFSVGGERDPGHVGPKAWSRLAKEMQMSPKRVVSLARSIAERVDGALPRVAARVVDEGADRGVVEHVARTIGEHARRALTLHDAG